MGYEKETHRFKPLRVLHVVPIISHTGIWRHLQAAQLISDKFASHACVEIFDLGESHSSGPLTMPVTRIKASVSDFAEIDALTRALMVSANTFRPDVIHSYHVISDAYAGRVALRLGIPMIRTVAGIAQTNWSDPTSRASHIRWSAADIAQELAIEDGVYVTLAVSNAIRKIICDSGIPPHKVRTSYLGTAWPVPIHSRALVAGECTIGFLHRVEPVKLGPTFVPAIRLLRTSGARVNVVLIQTGKSFEDFFEQLKGAGATVLVLPPSEALWQTLPPLDCVVLDSLTEGLPLIPLEAMARGLPVIAAKVGGIPEAVLNGRNGLLFESGDVETLANGMSQLLRCPDLGLSLGIAGRQTVATQFNRAHHVDELTRVYDAASRGGTL